jgi:hypothetical protein
VLSQAAALVLVEAARYFSGLVKKPSYRWGRLLQVFQLLSKDAESIG